MKINYNVTGAERKSLVAAISQMLNTPAKYLGMPTAAYEAGGYNIDKTGALTGPDNRELIADLQELHGFKAVSEEYDAPRKRKGIMDILVDELNANETDGGHWERLHSTPQMECGDGRWRNLDGTFAATKLTENRADEDLDYGEAQHYPGRYANPDAPITEEMQNQLDEYAATVTDDHGGEYDENGKYIQGTGETVCFPEDGISSPGGDCFAASQIYTMLLDYPGNVTVKIYGMCASAASVVAMAGTKVLMSPTAMMLIHNPWTFAIGDKSEMLKAGALLDEVKESILNAYEIKTGLSRVKLSHLMDDETPMNVHKAIALGFADGILTDDKRLPKQESEQPQKADNNIKIAALYERLNLLNGGYSHE